MPDRYVIPMPAANDEAVSTDEVTVTIARVATIAIPAGLEGVDDWHALRIGERFPVQIDDEVATFEAIEVERTAGKTVIRAIEVQEVD